MASTAHLLKIGFKMLCQAKPSDFSPKKWDWQKINWPFRILIHPINALQEIKYENKGSVALGILIMAVLFFSQVFSFLQKGFIFNYNIPEKLDVRFELAMSVLPVLLWCVANWSICTLMDGEGKFREIFITTSYAAMPMVVTLVPAAIISGFMTVEESTFLSFLSIATTGWIALILFLSSMIIHQYSFWKTIASMLLTVFVIAVILFLGVLVYSLFLDFYSFVATVTLELFFRM